MFLFAAAFFGGLLLVPTYFQEVRGESTLAAGLLVAPQGIGAMLTMPIAGTLSDRIPVGRIVPVGMVLIIIGMFGLTQVTATTPYGLLIAELVVMGFGMGATMMPLFTSALKTLKSQEVARGSTLLNIIQQIASSCGVAVISVVLTSHLNGGTQVDTAAGTESLANLAIAKQQNPSLLDQLQVALSPDQFIKGLGEAADSFANTYWVAWVLIVLTLIPVAFLPRKQEKSPLLDEDESAATAAMMH
jgi:MFS family permease